MFPISDLNASYIEWVNPEVYSYNTQDGILHNAQCEKNMSVFVTKSKIYRGIDLDALVKHVKKLQYIENLRSVYSRLASIATASVGVCKVEFVESKTIEEYYRPTIISKLQFVANELYPLIDGCEKYFDEKDGWKINALKKVYESVKKADETDFTSVKNILSDLIPCIEQTKEATKNNLIEADLQKLIDVLIKIQEIILMSSSSILGLCCFNKSTIYLCLENIVDEAQDKQISEKHLAESVFAHEYTHYLHISLMSGNPQNNDIVSKDAVLETVAETMQYIFAQKNGDVGLVNWVEKHSEKRVFPGWGYAGESILRTVSKKTKISEPSLLDLVICVSKRDWSLAYSLINAFKTEKYSITLNYVTFYDERNVWAISKLYVPYTIGEKDSMNSEKHSLKSALQSALGKIIDATTGNLYAEFCGKAPSGADIENLLFYNIDGKSCFSSLATDNLSFSGEKSSIVFDKLYYYHYQVLENPVKKSDKPICKWDGFEISKINSNTKPYAYFDMMKRNAANIKTDAKIDSNESIFLELTIHVPNEKLKPKSIVRVVKPMIDGIICGLHQSNGINCERIATMIASRYTVDKTIVEKQLGDNLNVCLPKREYIKPYRKDVNNSFKWDPQDDLLKYVSIEVKKQDNAKLSISGKLFKM